MAYERYDPEERRWREGGERHRDWDRERGWSREDDEFRSDRGGRGFLGRMGEEVRSWFGDDDREERAGRGERRWSPPESARTYNPRYEDELEPGSRQMHRSEGERGREDRVAPEWDYDPYRRTSFAGSRAR